MMSRADRRGWGKIGPGLILVATALAPARPQDPREPAAGRATPAAPGPMPTLEELARFRAEEGQKTADLAWLYYSENRIDSDQVYRWSRRSWEADRDAATGAAGRIAAAEKHLDRMLKLQAKIARIRQLGFGSTLDVAEADYYVREALFWRARAHEQAR